MSMSITEQANMIRQRQLETAQSRRAEAEERAMMKELAALGALSKEDAAELERLQNAEMAADEALEAQCKSCPNADICIASLRNACPHFLRSEIASRRVVWFRFLKEKHVCHDCNSFDEKTCWCLRHKKVVEADTDACERYFPICAPCKDPDALWFPNRPLSPHEQEIHARGHRDHAEQLAKALRNDPETYAALRKATPDYYAQLEKEFPELFPADLLKGLAND